MGQCAPVHDVHVRYQRMDQVELVQTRARTCRRRADQQQRQYNGERKAGQETHSPLPQYAKKSAVCIARVHAAELISQAGDFGRGSFLFGVARVEVGRGQARNVRLGLEPPL